MKAIKSLGYNVDNFNKETGLITFHTGMSWRTWAGQDVSVLISEGWPSGAEVVVDAQKRMTLQISDWGEGDAIARKLFDKLEELLKSEDTQKPAKFEL